MENEEILNDARLDGTVEAEPGFSHKWLGEKYYTFPLAVKRPRSGIVDHVPIMVSERLTDMSRITEGATIAVEGSFRSHQEWIDGKNRMFLNVFADYLAPTDSATNKNAIMMTGAVFREPKYRTTPTGKEITDLILTVSRPYGKTDHIPCIVWGRNAAFVGRMSPGTCIQCMGRIQSRMYMKSGKEHMAYEVSLSLIEEMDDDEMS